MTSVTNVEVLDQTCASVHYKGPRGGANETVVHFNRHGKVAYGFGEKGAIIGYLPSNQIEDFVVTAAWEAINGRT